MPQSNARSSAAPSPSGPVRGRGGGGGGINSAVPNSSAEPPVFARPFVRFRFGDRLLSLPAQDVLWVAPTHEPVPLPNFPQRGLGVVGLTLWQGRIVLMIASDSTMSSAPNLPPSPAPSRLLFARLGSGEDAEVVALRADEVFGVFEQSADWPILTRAEVVALVNDEAATGNADFARQAH